MAWSEQLALLYNTEAWATSALTYGCPDPGGWGPFDPIRFDFTSCFESLLYALPVAILAFGSAVELARLSRRPDYGPKGRGQRSQQLYTSKLVLAAALVGVQAVFLGARVAQSPEPTGDARIWSNVALLVGFVLAVPLHHYSHLRSRCSSTVLLFYYLSFLVIDAARLRTLISLRSYATHVAPFVIFCARLGLLLVVFALECVGPESATTNVVRLPEDGSALGTEREERVECPVVRANIFSRLTFAWMTPMMSEGYRKYLNEEDLWALPRPDQADALAARMRKAWHDQLGEVGGGPSLPRAIVKAFGRPYMEALVLKLINDCLQFLQPQLLRGLLTFVNSYKSGEGGEETHHGYIIALGMFACGILQTAFLHQYFKRCFETGMRIRGGLIALIYSKSLVMSNEERTGRATGDVVNLMSTDVSRLQDVTSYGLIALSGAFQIILAFLSLYQLLGWSMLSGVAVMVLSIPLNAFLARYSTRLNKQQMKNKDQRTRLMNEILNNIRSIKLYAYENAFTRRLLAIRNDRELKLLRKMGFVNSANSFMWNLMPFLVAFSSFAIFSVTSGKPLTPALVFPAISLFQLLQFPLNVLPMVINSWIEAYVSVGRLTGFLTGKELQKDATVREDIVGAASYGDDLVKMEAADFAWSTTTQQPTLSGISLNLKKGQLIAVVGRVGSGKSSLLAAALGEMTRLQGSVRVRGKVAYAAQSAWLLSASVKENIVFGHRWDEDFYKQTIEACALKEDLAMLKDGDETQVGEKGISLSGGQKARISMARAVYARADVYFLDDCLAAVDSHVARHLFDNVIGPNGILCSKARLLCTNAIPYCQEADELIMLRNGKIIERGSYSSVLESDGELNKLLAEFGKKTRERESGEPEADSDGSSDTAVDFDKSKEAASKSMASSRSNLRRQISAATVRRASLVPADQQKRAALKAYKSSTRVRESRATGSVKLDIYKRYIQANGYLGVAIYCFTILAQQGASIGTNFWLRAWSSSNESSHGNAGLGYYLGIYAALGFASSFLMLINGIFLYAFCVVRSARILHDSMYEAVLRSPMSFFEQTPIGTILNRFSRDVYVTDEILARVFSAFFRTMGSVVGVIAVITYSVPPFLIVCIPLMFLYKRIQSYYLATSRELKRLDATTKSPIFASFGETLSGLSTIRAFKQQERFIADNEARLDRNQEAFYPSISCNRWLAVRLELIGSFIILCAAVLAVFSLLSTTWMDAGLVGLLMSYALSTTQSLNWVVRSATEVETNIVSLERMIEYANLPSEAPQEIPDRTPEPSWPEAGSIVWKNYSCRYRDDLDPVLKDLSFEIKGGEKIGVCGRTGAGKSTITMGLYRVIEPANGTIEIDGVDITKIGLHALRSRLSIIPQDSQCFEGTLRQNLDPAEEYTDDQLWSALESSKLKEHVQSMGGLEAKVEEGGANLSNGQRQLMCLARALLRRSKILVMDEATSAVDPESDRDIQAVIRQEFEKATLFVIAHRLNTIMDCDRILVLSAGKVVELGSPAELLQNPEGVFTGMCKEAGIDPASVTGDQVASSVA